MKHTKGKWEVTNLTGKYFEVSAHTETIKRNSGYPVAKITTHVNEQAKANAKLISKAPEMYEALKSTYSHLLKEYNKYEFQDQTTIARAQLKLIKSLLKEIES
jgi:hypothetical protein